MTTIRNLVFKGGGVLGLSYVGALQVLEERSHGEFLRGVTRVAGSSVGSIVAAAVACGCSVERLRTLMLSIDYTSLLDDSWGVCEDLYRMYTQYGFYKGDALYRLISDVIGELTGEAALTFGGLYAKTGRHLVITGTNANTGQTVYFSRIQHPNMEIRIAVRLSASFPFFFRSLVYRGCRWVDGGLLDNYPIRVFDTERYCTDGYNRETLGFNLVSSSDDIPTTFRYEDEPAGDEQPIQNVKQFTVKVCEAVYAQCQEAHVRPVDMQRSINIDVRGFSSMDFYLSDERKQQLIAAGSGAAKSCPCVVETPRPAA